MRTTIKIGVSAVAAALALTACSSSSDSASDGASGGAAAGKTLVGSFEVGEGGQLAPAPASANRP